MKKGKDSTKPKRKVVKAARFLGKALRIIRINETPTDSTFTSNIYRWRTGRVSPTESALQAAGEKIWREYIDTPSNARARLLTLFHRSYPKVKVGASESTFIECLTGVVSETYEAKKVNPSEKRSDEFHKISKPADDAVLEGVHFLLEHAKIRVVDDKAILDADTHIDLNPLYRYVASLQKSATIPSYFPGIPDIQLDALYVELCASEDQRGLGLHSADSWEEADQVRPDYWGLWRAAVVAKSIPFATLISRTELLPAVVFGDPGSGKSTLTRYGLHELGRSLVNPKHVLGLRVLPFRLVLREFAEEGKMDRFSILRHLARRHLEVPEESLDDWVFLLGHMFSNNKPSKLFLFVDGIDEVTPAADGYRSIHQNLQDVTSIARVLFTSRRAGFKSPVMQYDAFEVIELSPMSIHAMIRNWFAVVTPRSETFVHSLARWIFADSRRQEMAANPCLLSLICYLNEDRRPNRFLQPRSRARLYELVVQKLIGANQKPLPDDPHVLKTLLAAFALKRYRAEDDHRAPLALFSELQLERILNARIRGANALTTRLPAAQLLQTWREMRLVFQWNLSDWHSFLHLTLQEYFAAQALFDLPEDEFAQVLDRNRYNPYWREVWRFYAGLCRLDPDQGKHRFRTLLRSFMAEQDLFGEIGFLAAPLCAEYRLLDTTEVLGFDLKRVLYGMVRDRHHASMEGLANRKGSVGGTNVLELQEARVSRDAQLIARVRIVVELDPDYFLNLAKQVIEDYRQVKSHRGHRPGRHGTPDRAEVLLACIFLSCNYDEEALEFQAGKIREEALDLFLKDADPPLGPLVPSGRNEGLTKAISEMLPRAKGWLAKERLIRYLANTRDPNAGRAIFKAAKAEVATKLSDRALAFRVRCLTALCDLQDPSAVVLANELIELADFRAKYLDQVCAQLALVKHPTVAELLEG